MTAPQTSPAWVFLTVPSVITEMSPRAFAGGCGTRSSASTSAPLEPWSSGLTACHPLAEHRSAFRVNGCHCGQGKGPLTLTHPALPLRSPGYPHVVCTARGVPSPLWRPVRTQAPSQGDALGLDPRPVTEEPGEAGPAEAPSSSPSSLTPFITASEVMRHSALRKTPSWVPS